MVRCPTIAGILIAGLCLALSGTPAHAAEVDKYLPDETQFVMQLNVRQILDSALLRKHGLESLKAALKRNEDVQKVLQSLGLDPYKDIHRIVIAMAGGQKSEKNISIIYGKFDANKLATGVAELAKQFSVDLKVHEQDGARLYELTDEGTEPVFAVLLDEKTLAAGDKESVTDALARHKGKKPATIRKELKELIEKADDRHAVWFAGTAMRLGKVERFDEKSRDKVDKVLATIETVSGSLQMTGDVQFEMAVTAKNANGLEDVRDTLSEALGAMKAGVLVLTAADARLEPLGDALKTFKVRTRDKSIVLSGQVSGQVIEKIRKALDEVLPD